TAATKTSPPSQKGTMKDIESDIRGMVNQITDLSIIGDTYKRDYLTWAGKLKSWTIDKVLKAGTTAENIYNLSPEERSFARGFTRFHNAVYRIHNKYVHDVSGAQFSVKEMERYEKSLFNMKQNYEAFEAAYNDYINFVKKGYRLKRIALRKGIDSEEVEKEFKRLSLLSVDPSISDENTRSRGLELEEEFDKRFPGKTARQKLNWVTIQLHNEGYF
ncbi:MAG: hypothetical protein R3321_10920, partial [Nitrososphaeraceae archaeon]|nr:hypothetical protein [Nitrososphaeraceae archaeon]